jgi:hypothetical protein
VRLHWGYGDVAVSTHEIPHDLADPLPRAREVIVVQAHDGQIREHANFVRDLSIEVVMV